MVTLTALVAFSVGAEAAAGGGDAACVLLTATSRR